MYDLKRIGSKCTIKNKKKRKGSLGEMKFKADEPGRKHIVITPSKNKHLYARS